MIYPFNIVAPPPHVIKAGKEERWRRINPMRLRREYWWWASGGFTGIKWVLAIGTVVVTGILAGRPGSHIWADDEVRTWSTLAAILAGLSGLIPWQQVALTFGRAHEALGEVIMLYDADETFTVRHVLEVAQEGGRWIRGLEDMSFKRSVPKHQKHQEPPPDHTDQGAEEPEKQV